MAMHDDARFSLLALLRPWLDALRDAVSFKRNDLLDFEDVKSDDVVWVNAKTPAGQIDDCVFEALELLALARCAGFSIWRSALLIAASSSCEVAIPERGIACPIGCVVFFSNREDAKAISARCRPRADAGSVSNSFWVVRQRLMRLCMSEDTSRRDTQVTPQGRPIVPVQVRLFQRGFEQQLQHVIHIVSAQREHESHAMFDSYLPDHWKPVFRVTCIATPFSPRLTPMAFRYLTQISSSGVAIDRISAKDHEISDSTADNVIRGLQTLLGTENSASTVKERSVGSLNVPVRLAPNVMAAVFSAVHSSQSTCSLSVSNEVNPLHSDPDRGLVVGRAERDYFWRWVAFALFGPYATRSVQDITIYSDGLSSEGVEAYCLQLDNPDTVPAYSPSNGLASIPIIGSVEASRFYLRRPGASESETVAEIVELTPRRVLALSSGTPCGELQEVLLPGYGVAWACSSPIEDNPSAQSRPEHSVRSFNSSNVDDAGKDSMLRLFQAFGSHLSKITLACINTLEPLDSWLAAVLRSCPQLKTLQLTNGGQLDSLMTFVKLYDRDECRASRVKLSGVRVNDKESVVRFLSTLGDRSHSITRHLQVFSYEEDYVRTPMPGLLMAIEAMLENNRALLELEIAVSFEHHVQSIDQAHVARIVHTHRGTRVPVRRRSLERPAKTAFLSALMKMGFLYSLDINLLKLVFEFAAECERRHVAVNCCVEEP